MLRWRLSTGKAKEHGILGRKTHKPLQDSRRLFKTFLDILYYFSEKQANIYDSTDYETQQVMQHELCTATRGYRHKRKIKVAKKEFGIFV
jgi:hypothetical protein